MDWGRIFRILFWIQVGVNLIGVLGPEISFDALWYHLPISRMLAERGWWGTIPGGLLYPSGMPRLLDWINGGLLWLARGWESPEILPKLLSWLLGLGCARLIYLISRRYFSQTASSAAVILWYSTLLVGWQSIVVYIDLGRTFLVLLSVWYFLESKWAISAIFVALAYSIKFMSLPDALFLGLAGTWIKKDWRVGAWYFASIVVAITFWAFLNMLSGYEYFYPFFGFNIVTDKLHITSQILISPLIEFVDPRARVGPVILVLLLVVGRRVMHREELRAVIVATGAVLISWVVFLQYGHGRYFLPALALLASLAGAAVDLRRGGRLSFRRIAIGLVVFNSLFGIAYRVVANAKFVPVLLRTQTKGVFLTERLNFESSDWYDVDGWVTGHLRDTPYLVVGVHNTYYLPGRLWDHDSFAQPDFCYPYILVQGDYPSPEHYDLVHSVEETRTSIYRDPTC